jgi:hypothetical protein
VETSLPLPQRALALSSVAAWRLALGGLVALSIATRVAIAWSRATPNYFPDEYLYAALSRGVGSVRVEWAHFPALLQPLLTAPLWHLGSLETGYRAVQAFDAAAMSLAAIPVWLLARRLGVTRGLALGCAALALALPDLMYASWIVAEPVAYPLVLGAVAAIVAAVERPTRRAQALALALCLLAAFARVQFVVLPLVYLVAAFAHDGRRAPGRHRALIALLALAALGVAALGPWRVLGYYNGVLAAHVSAGDSVRSVGRNLLLLAYAGGFALVPGALLGLARAPRAFRATTVALTALLLAQASLLGDIGIPQERYVFYVLPLLGIAFALNARRGRLHAVLCVALFTLAAVVPLAGWAAADGKTHSPFLIGVFKIEVLAGEAGTGALIVGAGAGVLALLAIAAPRAVTLALAVVTTAAVGAAAVAFDADNSRAVRAVYVAPDRSWVDHAGVGRATVLLGPETSKTATAEQLFWNRSIDRVVALDGAVRPDRFAVAGVAPGGDGSLGVRGPLLVDGFGSTLRFANARVVARFDSWTFVRPHGEARLELQATGRYADGWLAPAGRISVWGRTGTVSLTLSSPEPTTISFHWPGHTKRVAVGTQALRVEIPVASVPFTAAFRASSSGFVGSRQVSARATAPVLNRTLSRADNTEDELPS